MRRMGCAWWMALCACGEPPREDELPGTSSMTSGGAQDDGGSTTGTIEPSDDTISIKLDVSGIAMDLGGGAAGCDAVAELPTNQGCEFWAVDLPNVSVVPPLSIDTVPADQQFAVVVTNPASESTANVEIFRGADATPIASGPVPFDTMRVFELPALNIAPGTTSAEGTAYRIESDLPITAYQFQPLDNTSPVYSNDATILFPTHVLGSDYTAITGDATLVAADGFAISSNNTGAFVSVVGVQDDTTVTLFPTATLHPGAIQNVVIGRGQVLTAISSQSGTAGDLSGTRVVADKPVAVFAGSVATSEPGDTTACCADHLEHQMLPLTAWGTRYVAAPAAAAMGTGNDASLWRITGAFDGTALQWDPAPPPGAPTSIDAYETATFITELPFVVTAQDDSKPFAVTQFLLSNQYFSAFGRPGDPTMIVLPAAEQFQTKYVFLVPQGYATSFATVIVPEGVEIDLDGTTMQSSTLSPLGLLEGTGYRFAHLPVPAGSHRIEASEPFGIIVSGHAPDVSYGYAGGSGIEVIHEPPPPPG